MQTVHALLNPSCVFVEPYITDPMEFSKRLSKEVKQYLTRETWRNLYSKLTKLLWWINFSNLDFHWVQAKEITSKGKLLVKSFFKNAYSYWAEVKFFHSADKNITIILFIPRLKYKRNVFKPF